MLIRCLNGKNIARVRLLYHTIKSFLSLSIFVPKPQNHPCQKTESHQRVKSSGYIICPVRQLHPSQQARVPPWIVVSYARRTSIPFTLVPNLKAQTHDKMISTLKSNDLCMNCLKPGHFVKQCKSLHRCHKCQKPHHTLLHVESKEVAPSNTTPIAQPSTQPTVNPVSSNTAMGFASNSLLMTCRVLIDAPDGSSVEARAILDSASSASFVSERLAQSVCLSRSNQGVRISGIAGLSHNSPSQSVASFNIHGVVAPCKKISVSAIIIPRVTCDLPLHPVPFDMNWKHLSDIQLADPMFGHPGQIDILLGVDIFVQVWLHGQRVGPPGSPVAFETTCGWILAGNSVACHPIAQVTTYHASISSSDDILQKFWEIEESPMGKSSLSPEERSVIHHFETNHYRLQDGRFVVPLPRKPDARPLGESRSQAVRRFLTLEHSLRYKGQFEEVDTVIQEYFEHGHAEVVPDTDREKSPRYVFYLPIHAVRKESSTTTKVRAVFDASAKSSTGVSLNDLLLVGPTVHPPLVDVLLRFRQHRVALTTDVSRMYRAVLLPPSDQDLHRFVWRRNPGDCFGGLSHDLCHVWDICLIVCCKHGC